MVVTRDSVQIILAVYSFTDIGVFDTKTHNSSLKNPLQEKQKGKEYLGGDINTLIKI